MNELLFVLSEIEFQQSMFGIISRIIEWLTCVLDLFRHEVNSIVGWKNDVKFAINVQIGALVVVEQVEQVEHILHIVDVHERHDVHEIQWIDDIDEPVETETRGDPVVHDEHRIDVIDETGEDDEVIRIHIHDEVDDEAVDELEDFEIDETVENDEFETNDHINMELVETVEILDYGDVDEKVDYDEARETIEHETVEIDIFEARGEIDENVEGREMVDVESLSVEKVEIDCATKEHETDEMQLRMFIDFTWTQEIFEIIAWMHTVEIDEKVEDPIVDNLETVEMVRMGDKWLFHTKQFMNNEFLM